MYESYRVRRRFQWRGWELAPKNSCDCGCGHEIADEDGHLILGPIPTCTGETAVGCQCRETICRCTCGIPRATYGGDIWIVEAGHPRKDMMLGQRFALGDASLPTVDEFLEKEEYQRLLSPPMESVKAKVIEESATSTGHKRRISAGVQRI